MLRAPLLACAAALTLCSTPALAQGTATEAQRAAVFQQMLADPSNRDLMRDYARLSVQLRDFEGAAATLERLVDLEPENTGARVELAIAYFALGSYAVAEYHLAAAQASGALTPEQAAQVARYREEAQERDDESDYSGRVELGYAWPQTSGDEGQFINAAIDWRIDMGGAHASQWVTEFAYTGFRTGTGSLNGRQSARLRTGPEFRIAQDAYGPRLQPYVQVEWVNRDDAIGGGYTEWSIGAAYQNPLTESLTVYADLAVGEGVTENMFVPDYRFHEASLGLTYRPSRETRLRFDGWLGEEEEVEALFPVTTTTGGVRLSAQHAFNPGFSMLPNRWVVGGFGEIEQSEESNPFFTSDIDARSHGLWLRAFVLEDIYVEAAAAQVTQDTTSFGFTNRVEETVYTLQVGWEF